MASEVHYFLFFFGKPFQSFCWLFSLETGFKLIFFWDFIQFIWAFGPILKLFLDMKMDTAIPEIISILVIIIGFLSAVLGVNGLDRSNASWIYQYYITMIFLSLIHFGIAMSFLKYDTGVKLQQKYDLGFFEIMALFMRIILSKVIWSAYIRLESNDNSSNNDRYHGKNDEMVKENLATQTNRLDLPKNCSPLTQSLAQSLTQTLTQSKSMPLTNRIKKLD